MGNWRFFQLFLKRKNESVLWSGSLLWSGPKCPPRPSVGGLIVNICSLCPVISELGTSLSEPFRGDQQTLSPCPERHLSACWKESRFKINTFGNCQGWMTAVEGKQIQDMWLQLELHSLQLRPQHWILYFKKKCVLFSNAGYNLKW